MKASILNTEQRIESANNQSYGIQTYGEHNDYPQRLAEIVSASRTGNKCVNIYQKFIAGRGFNCPAFNDCIVNSKMQTVSALLQLVADDLAHYGGFALHINYNALYEITSVHHIPFEWLRFENLDENFKFDKLKMHPDWGKRYSRLRKFNAKDIETFGFFNPNPEHIQKEVDAAGGWNGYKGQILYYSRSGDKVYPTPIYEAVVTDMSVEEGLSNISYRNVRHNFLPAGILVDYDNTNNSEDQEAETKAELEKFQGDVNAGQIMYVQVENQEKAPEFIPFQGKNYDKEFTETEDKTPQTIGGAFLQPPILRAEDVGAGFGADLMQNAYHFYNTITEDERKAISEQFKKIFDLWHNKAVIAENDYLILPKIYEVNATLAERLGSNTDKVLEIVFNDTLEYKRKASILRVIYGISDDKLHELLNNTEQ